MQREKLILSECYRLLKPNGMLIIQDRTPEDCLLPGSATHIRGYFFSQYPKLIHTEVARRHEHSAVYNSLQYAGFDRIHAETLWETRKEYETFEALADDLLARTGRSILHELTDEELRNLVAYIKENIYENQEQDIQEQDRWTIWAAQKGGNENEFSLSRN